MTLKKDKRRGSRCFSKDPTLRPSPPCSKLSLLWKPVGRAVRDCDACTGPGGGGWGTHGYSERWCPVTGVLVPRTLSRDFTELKLPELAPRSSAPNQPRETPVLLP